MAAALPDSDSENKESSEDEVSNNTMFRNDVSNLLKRSVNDTQHLIRETDELRKLYNVESSDVPRIIMHCLLLHPNPTDYMTELHLILRKSSALVEHLRGAPQAMDYLLQGVESSIVKLIRRLILQFHSDLHDLLGVIHGALGADYVFPSIIQGLQEGKYGMGKVTDKNDQIRLEVPPRDWEEQRRRERPISCEMDSCGNSQFVSGDTPISEKVVRYVSVNKSPDGTTELGDICGCEARMVSVVHDDHSQQQQEATDNPAVRKAGTQGALVIHPVGIPSGVQSQMEDDGVGDPSTHVQAGIIQEKQRSTNL